MARRGYKGGTAATTLAGDINDTVTTIAAASLATWAGLTSNGPGTATINRGKSDEETITFTGISTNNLTGVTRGAGGTTAQAHSSGATIEHTSFVTDFDEANAHIADPSLDHHTQYLKKALATTKGDLFVATGAGTIVRLGVGTDGQVLTADAASAGGQKWATAATVLGRVQYAPNPGTSYSCHATTLGALDTTNLRLALTVPASGNVVIRLTGVVLNTDTTGVRTYVGVLAGSTTIGYLCEVDGGNVFNSHPFSVEMLVTGLTPGAATWDYASVTQGFGAIYVAGVTAAGTLGGPAKMEVMAA